MCDFCIKHGDGNKWYLQARNYAEDLASDVRRRKFVAHFFNETMKPGPRDALHGLRRLQSAPASIRRLIGGFLSRRTRRDHFGQIVPLEDVEQIFDICNGIVVAPCVCRRLTRETESAFCIGLSVNPHRAFTDGIVSADYWDGPPSASLERLTRDQAVARLREFEGKSLCHSVWTFGTPFIGAVCNCDRTDCLALLSTFRADMKMMFRGEYVARADPELCRGCRSCIKNCQFNAISYSAAAGKCQIDEQACWGCGVCRAACQRSAIALLDRKSVPAVARLW